MSNMKEKGIGLERPFEGGVLHLPRRREALTDREALLQEVDLTIAGHFREQNEILRSANSDLKRQIAGLTNGIERLVGEMHGLRTGRKEQAFAKICGPDVDADLPTVKGEAAFWYTHTSFSIGRILGYHSSQIGLLLGPKGLGWAGDGDYQEIGRAVGKGHSKFWHEEVPRRLISILDQNEPEKYGIIDKSVLSIFRRWQERREADRRALNDNGNRRH